MKRPLYTPKPGDLVTTSGTGFVSGVINIGTFGVPGRHASHIGIIADVKDRRLVIESTSVLPEGTRCEITGEEVSGVQAHTLRDLTLRPGRAWVHPLHRPLYSHESQRLTLYLMSRLGDPYDMPGALRSGGLLFSFFESVLRPEDLATLFCSELVASALETTGLSAFRNASSWSPNKLVRRLTWRGLYNPRIELDPEKTVAAARRIEVSNR